MMKRALLVFTFLFSTLLFSQVFAMTPPRDNYKQDNTEEREQAREKRQMELDEKKQRLEQEYKEMQENKEARVADRCENTKERVQERIDRFYENKDFHVEKYNKVLGGLVNISAKLEEAGLDVSALNSAIDAYKAQANNYAETYSSFIAQLESTKELACGDSEGAYKSALQEAHDTLLQARKERLELRATYKNIRSIIVDLRVQYAAQKGATNE